MPDQNICCNPFKLRNHTWIGKGVPKASSAFKEKFLVLGKYISCRFHISNNTIPSKKVSVSVNNNNNTPFEENPAEEPSDPSEDLSSPD